MGVDNLMGFVKNATTQTSLNRIKVRDSTAAVDVSHWMYKASYACPEALYHKELRHNAYKTIINYIDNYVRLLIQHNVKLTFVFDGMKLPAKQGTHQERAARKAEARRLVEKFLASGDKSEARKQMLRCTDIKFDVVEQVIKYCKDKGINYIVAPYEADAQLAYLNNINMCEFIITEDTDLILYGCKKIIYKLDTSGNCVLYDKKKLAKCLGPKGDEVEFEKFRWICILSGCDYLKNIPGMGLQNAKKFFLMTKQDNLELLLPKIPVYTKSAKFEGKVTKEYIRNFIDANSTFRHHIVYDPKTENLRPLEPYPKGLSSSNFPKAGKRFDRTMAKDLIKGAINLDKLDPENDLDSASDKSDIEDEDEVVLSPEHTAGNPVKRQKIANVI